MSKTKFMMFLLDHICSSSHLFHLNDLKHNLSVAHLRNLDIILTSSLLLMSTSSPKVPPSFLWESISVCLVHHPLSLSWAIVSYCFTACVSQPETIYPQTFWSEIFEQKLYILSSITCSWGEDAHTVKCQSWTYGSALQILEHSRSRATVNQLHMSRVLFSLLRSKMT